MKVARVNRRRLRDQKLELNLGEDQLRKLRIGLIIKKTPTTHSLSQVFAHGTHGVVHRTTWVEAPSGAPSGAPSYRFPPTGSDQHTPSAKSPKMWFHYPKMLRIQKAFTGLYKRERASELDGQRENRERRE